MYNLDLNSFLCTVWSLKFQYLQFGLQSFWKVDCRVTELSAFHWTVLWSINQTLFG
ncbi:hypothetical protein RND71_027878 [Anisodus tanguticus]|uniref:Uncharacterized protein n=1 Tax=Anisodus tanguticus TaxID=243964 RepID=A0AAE1V9I8_9SOLA|nr:hypothetical protein RND71_027878 [Anisodus tanguticus]